VRKEDRDILVDLNMEMDRISRPDEASSWKERYKHASDRILISWTLNDLFFFRHHRKSLKR